MDIQVGLNSQEGAASGPPPQDRTPVAANGQKTMTNKRQQETQLKLLSTDPNSKDQMPAPLLSQQYRSGNQKFDMLRHQANKKLNSSEISDSALQPHLQNPQTQAGRAQPHLSGPVIHDVADFGSVNGPQLMVSEIRTNAVITLCKLMVAKGKQHLELQERLNFLKQLQIKTELSLRKTG